MRALVRPPSASYANCIRSDASTRIDPARALDQHAAYVDALRACGLDVVALPPEPDMPDACFVEDAVVMIGSIAVIARPRPESRRRETASVEKMFDDVRRIERGFLDGGDVMIAGDRAFVGLSDRTDETGATELSKLIDVRTVPVNLLHLKTGVTPIGPRALVQIAGAYPRGTFEGFEIVEVDEPRGGNVLAIDGHAIVSAAAPRTAEALRHRGLIVHVVDLGEFHKGDGAVTCLSVILP